MQIPAGMIYDKYNEVKVISLSLLMLAIGCIFFSLSNHLWLAVASRIWMGFASSFAFLGALCIGKNYFSAKHFPLIVGITEAMGSLTKEINHTTTTATTAFKLSDLGMVIKNKNLWLLGLSAGFMYTHIIVMINLWNIKPLQYNYNITTLLSTFIDSTTYIGLFMGFLTIGRFKKFLSEINIIFICSIFIAITIFASFYIQLQYNTNIRMFLEAINLFIMGFSTGGVVIIFDIAKNIVPESIQGMTLGFINMFFGGLAIIFMPIVSYLLARTEGYSIAASPILVSSILLIICIVILKIRLPHTRKSTLL